MAVVVTSVRTDFQLGGYRSVCAEPEDTCQVQEMAPSIDPRAERDVHIAKRSFLGSTPIDGFFEDFGKPKAAEWRP